VRAIHHQPASDGAFAEIPAAVDLRLRAALAAGASRGCTRTEPPRFEHTQAGRNTVVVTPAGSGKMP
jgi:hypothetical protein